jgi:hypothetical protein
VKRELKFYAGVWAALLVFLVVNTWHRAPSGRPAHLHTTLTGVLAFAFVIVAGTWGAMIAHRYFNAEAAK